MIKKVNIKDRSIAEQVLPIQLASYQIEADIIQFYDIPPLKETIEDLMNVKEEFLAYYDNGALAGLLSYEEDGPSSITICRMMVHPDFHRKGIASALIEELFALTSDCEQWKVTTGAKNEPAKKLYLKHGFTEEKIFEVVPGLIISSFIRTFTADS
ncbi:GNAT family N-acetyltransferase [Falsibacillus pallidus]|uniref:GNAT family N-acetyltransferase n=1 Tax=Falsibacillus pallidus TaxID=493781 RepID=UPI003D98AA5B